MFALLAEWIISSSIGLSLCILAERFCHQCQRMGFEYLLGTEILADTGVHGGLLGWAERCAALAAVKVHALLSLQKSLFFFFFFPPEW